MNIVGGYPQMYPGGSISHSDFYGYPHPATHGVPQNRYQDSYDNNGQNSYFQNWMYGQNEYSFNNTDSYGYSSSHLQNSPCNEFSLPYGYSQNGPPEIRPNRRRGSANKKERRRTLSINTAFSNLRGCIPNVPSDTKLSKIKTLRLATSYIGYLMDVLDKDDPKMLESGFKAEVPKTDRSERKRLLEKETELANGLGSPSDIQSSGSDADCTSPPAVKKTKGRTGWPQHVWAAELKQ